MNRFAWSAAVLPILVCLSAAAAAEPETLVRLAPDSTNTLGVIRVDEILETPLAENEGWEERPAEFLNGASRIPPWAELMVLTAEVYPTVPEEVWTIALLPMPEGIDLATVAWHEHSPVQQLAGFPSARSRRGAWLVQLQPDVLAVRTPAVRQATARWLRNLSSKNPPRSDYLTQVAADAPHVLFALDMTDALDPTLMSQRLDELPELQDQPERHRQLLDQVLSLRGIRFTARIEDSINARVMLDFARQPNESDASHLRSLFLTLLSDLQAELDEFARAEVSVEDRSVVLATELSSPGFRRVMSLLPSPAPEKPAAPDITDRSEQTGQTRMQPTQAQTARYFESVTEIIDDLQRANRKAKNYRRTATWHDNFAKSIDQLPAAGVHPNVVEFGSETASRLRALAASLRGVAVEVDTQRRTVTYDVKVRPGWAAWNAFGGFGYRPGTWRVTSNLEEVRERIAKAVAEGAKEREQIWRLIESDRQDMLEWLRQKYGPDFGKHRRRRAASSATGQ